MGTGNRQALLHLSLSNVTNALTDDTVNQNNGSIQGHPKLLSDPTFGNCLSFDGMADFVEIREPFTNQDSFTISIWVNPSRINDGAYHGILGKQGDATRKPGLWLSPELGALHYDSYDVAGAVRFYGLLDNFFLQANEWVHIAWVKEGTEYRFYRNGALFAVQPAPAAFFTASSAYWIGRVDSFWPGRLAHVRMHANPLSEEQIRQDMTLDLEGLLLYFPLDDIHTSGQDGRVVPDRSANERKGNVGGNTSLVIDDDFGPVLSFDGVNSQVEVEPFTQDFLPVFTVQTWVYANFLAGWQIICSNRDWEPTMWQLQFLDRQLAFSIYGNSPDHFFDFIFEPQKWYNLAVCYNRYKSEVRLYVNGEYIEQKSYNGAIPVYPAPLRLGGWEVSSRWLNGRMAGFRIYDRPLTTGQMRRNMLDDQGAAAAYRQSHPFDFDLLDGDVQGVIYIDDTPSNHTMTLAVKNASRKQLTLKALGAGAASADLHHLEMRFRPGTLSAPSLEQIALVQNADWQMSRPQPQSDGTMALFLKGPDAAILPPGSQKELKLQNVTADPEGGSRGANVEIRYRNFYYGNDAAQTVTGSKRQPLNIVNHRGRKNIPLHPGFMGPHRVLNDGQSESTVQIRLTNVLEDAPILLNNKASSDPAKTSKFILTFDVGPADKEWALGTRSQVAGIQVEVNFGDDPGGWTKIDESSHGTGISPQWEIGAGIDSLAAGKHIQIRLSRIKTGHASGNSNLYIHYENIPGYWEGQFVLAIEKSFLIHKDILDANNNFTGESRVGIGVAEPRTTLDLGKSVVSGALNDYIKAQFTMSGGGEVHWEGVGGRLKWSNRFIVISMERPNSFAHGHLNIFMPSTDIPASQVYSNQARSANADGIVLNHWEALYAVHPVGGGYMDVSFHIVRYDHNFNAPINWMLLAVVNGDDGSVKLGTGQILTSKSASFSGGSIFSKGMIMLWSGTVDTIPYGWALCNGENGTPLLTDRFVVAAGNSYIPGTVGGQHEVTLNINQIPAHNHSGGTSYEGNHQHWIEGTDANGLAHRHRTIAGTTTVDMGFGGGWNSDPNDARWRGHVNTDTAGYHGHSFTTNTAGGNQAHENRPPYYALAYIMKL